uniref:NADH dehydrogenase subunit 3 n=1 Tax=Urolabida histrionica TaxID=2880905 RepID=UPI001D11B311|nr:NADH dehydrogenase subunit 3 [Urolabida histrionica]UCC46136.1 NADH dehydrogenase subunit 3 [Urolabida histrionica]
MLTLMMLLMTSISVTFIMMLICMIISKSMMMDQQKMSPFECGFAPLNSARTPFSIQFFLIAMLFLIFDIEIAIILPIIMTSKLMLSLEWTVTTTMFIIILLMGLYHEWKNGMLEWI